jgi:hypothetical protein
MSGGRVKDVEEFSLQVLLPNQIQALVEAAGFTDVQFFGSCGRESFDRWSSDLMVLAQKPSVAYQ